MPKLVRDERRSHSASTSPEGPRDDSESEDEKTNKDKQSKIFKATLQIISGSAGVELGEMEKPPTDSLRSKDKPHSPFRTFNTCDELKRLAEVYTEQFAKKCREKSVKLGNIFRSTGFNEPLRAYAAPDKCLEFKALKPISSRCYRWLPEPPAKIELSDSDVQYIEELGRKVIRCLNFSLVAEKAIVDEQDALQAPVMAQITKNRE